MKRKEKLVCSKWMMWTVKLLKQLINQELINQELINQELINQELINFVQSSNELFYF